MSTNRIDREFSIEELRHPFVRLPKSAPSTIFQGWGPAL